MKSTKKHFILKTGEFLITPEHPDAKHYIITLNGKKLDDVIGLIRINLEAKRGPKAKCGLK